MAYYRVTLKGGAAEERAQFAARMGLRQFDPTAAKGIYYIEHVASRPVVEKAYQSTVGADAEVQVDETSEGEFRAR